MPSQGIFIDLISCSSVSLFGASQSQKNLPSWKALYVHFQVTPLGKVGMFFAIVNACSSVMGIVWTAINLAIILPPLLVGSEIVLLQSAVVNPASFQGS